MKLLKSIVEDVDLKKSDATDAGKNDIVNAAPKNDVQFSMMRNAINSENDTVTGSDVANYLEKAAEINNEVEAVPYGLETNDGEIIKVWVNAEEAEKFEERMKAMLGIEDDVEEAINRLATEFDIVDVIWPGEEEQVEVEASDDDLDTLKDDEEFDVFAEYDELRP